MKISEDDLGENSLIVVYSLDESHPTFAHQRQIVGEISKSLRKISVLSLDSSASQSVGQLPILTLFPKASRFRLIKLVRILFLFLNYLISNRPRNVFFFMTDLHCAVLSPFAKLFKCHIFLWYAHKSYSPWLRISNFFVDNILTSTQGSCPIANKKTLVLGQAIDASLFRILHKPSPTMEKGLTVGRLDRSKRIDYIVESFLKLQSVNSRLSLTLIGDPSNEEEFQFFSKKVVTPIQKLEIDSLKIMSSVPRNTLPKIYNSFDFFIHAYKGSLDKTTVEATLCGLPVLTENIEYRNIFGSWSDHGKESSLIDEYLALISLSDAQLMWEIQRRHDIALKSHNLVSWVNKVTELMLRQN